MKKKETGSRNIAPEYDLAFLDSSRSNSRFAEAYRTLRTNIHFSATDSRLRSVLLTSAGQSEGKTVTTANLAFTIAQTGKSVLVVDGDLRKPMLTRLFKARSSSGLTGLMSEMFQADIREGRLEDMSAQDLFRLISLQKRSGVLELNGENERMKILFLSGNAADTEWLTGQEEKKLLRILIRSQVLSKENAEIVFRRQKDTGQNPVRILLDMGMVSEKDIIGPVHISLAENMQVLSGMKKGTFRFSERSESSLRSLTDHSGPLRRETEKICEQFRGKNGELIWLAQKIDGAVIQTEIEGLSLLPSGVIPPNPSELLGSERMSFLISYLEKKFDFMLIDTPPILPASDALLVAPQVGGVSLVVKAGMLNRKMVAKAVEQLRRTQARLLGIILNRVDVKREGYYKYYQKYYNYYYSEAK